MQKRLLTVSQMELSEKPRSPRQRIKLIHQAIKASAMIEEEEINPNVKIYSNDLYIYSITVIENDQLCYLSIGVNHNDKGEPSEYHQLTIDLKGHIRAVNVGDPKVDNDLTKNKLLFTKTGEFLLIPK